MPWDNMTNMSGPRDGVAKQLHDDDPLALYLHSHGHTLNLAAGDAIKKCTFTKDGLDIVFKVSRLTRFSPNNCGIGEDKETHLGSEFYVQSVGRVRAASLKSLLSNSVILQQLWETAMDNTSDPTIKSRIIGVDQFR